jgi:hypothetical protein
MVMILSWHTLFVCLTSGFGRVTVLIDPANSPNSETPPHQYLHAVGWLVRSRAAACGKIVPGRKWE